MTLLSEIYASAPTDDMIIQTLVVAEPGKEPLRIVNQYEDQLLGGFLHEACGFRATLPSKNKTGQQTLNFTIGGISDKIQEYVASSLASDNVVTITYAEYKLSDKTAPAQRPYVMELTGGSFADDSVTMEASYYDILNTKWSRLRYTSVTAPGLLYIT